MLIWTGGNVVSDGKTLIEVTMPEPHAGAGNFYAVKSLDLRTQRLNFGSTQKLQGWDGTAWVDLSLPFSKETTNLESYSVANTLAPDTKVSKLRLLGIGDFINTFNIYDLQFKIDHSKTAFLKNVTCTDNIDGDANLNHLDVDSDGDGCSDAVELGVVDYTSNDIVTIPTGVDTDGDGLLDIYEANGTATYQQGYYDNFISDPNVNACADSDGDMIPDITDIDDDNDGILDIIEDTDCANPPATAVPSGQVNYTYQEIPYAQNHDVSPINATGFFDEVDAYGLPVSSLPIESSGTLPTFDKPPFDSANGDLVIQEFIIVFPAEFHGMAINIRFADSGGAVESGFWVASNSTDKFDWVDPINQNPTSAFFGEPMLDMGDTLGTGMFPLGTDSDSDTRGAYDDFEATVTASPGGNYIRNYIIDPQVGYNVGNFEYYNPNTDTWVLWDSNMYYTDSPCGSGRDTDNDGIPNRIDLDSDGDGCSDFSEAYSTTGNFISGTTEIVTTGTNWGANGFEETLETDTDNGIPTATAPSGLEAPSVANSTAGYANALDENTSTCGIDSDGDSVPDDVDLDDDNDEILDIVENCGGFISQNVNGPWEGSTDSSLTVDLPGASINDPSIYNFSDGQGNYYINSQGGDPSIFYSGNNTFTATFNPGVPANEIAFYVRDLDFARSPNGYFEVSANGAPAGSLFRFGSEITYSSTKPPFGYDAVISQIVQLTDSADQNGMFLGVGDTLITEITIEGFNLGSGDTIIYSLLSKVLCDTDGDGIINQLDLDSDGDGCSDLSEASASVSDGEQQTVAGPYGTNGFANNLESPADSGNATNAENTDDGTLYAAALDDQVLGCTMFLVEDDSATVNEDESVTIDILTNDNDIPTSGMLTITVPSNGTATINDGGTPNDPSDDTVTYTPDANYAGDDSFTYTICDAETPQTCHTATVNVTVTEVNDKPVAADDIAVGTEDTPLTVPVLEDDNDVDGTLDPATVAFVNPPTGATVSLDGSTMTVTGEGVWTINPTTGALTFTPEANFNGPATAIQYTVKDDDGLVSEPATVSVSLNAVDDIPIAEDDNETVDEDTPITIDVTANDTDVDGTLDLTSVTLVNPPAGATLSTDGNTLTVPGEGVWVLDPTNGKITFTPEENYTGTTTAIAYTVKDNDGLTSGHGDVVVTVSPINDKPAIADDVVTGTEDAPLTINVLENDNDVDGTLDPATVTFVNPPTGATVSPDGSTMTVPGEGVWTINPTTGALTFTPEANFNGPATAIQYTVKDADGLVSDPATVSVSLNAVDDIPIAEDDNETVDEDTPITIDVTANDTDVDGTLDLTSVTLVNPPAGATLSTDGNTLTVPGEGVWVLDPTNGKITFTPEENYTGTTTAIEYTVKDDNPSGASTSPATPISVTITPVNDAVNTAADIETGVEDTPITIAVLANDTDVDGTIDVTSVAFVNIPSGASISNDGNTLTVPDEGVWTLDSDTGKITFSPVLNYSGTATSIYYTVKDNTAAISEATEVSVTLTEVNDAPTTADDVVEAKEDTSIVIDVLENDADPGGAIDKTSVIFVNIPTGTISSEDGKTLTVPGEGVWIINPETGNITFTPSENFNGILTNISYTVADTAGLVSEPAIISGTVSAVNDDPVAENDTKSGLEDEPVTVDVLKNDFDDGSLNPTTVVFVNRPEGSSLSSDGNSLTILNQGVWEIDSETGKITFTPEEDYSGTTTPISYTVSDDKGQPSNPATVTITLTEVNDAPKVGADIINTKEDIPITKNVLANDNDPGGLLDKTSVVFVNPPTGTTLSDNGKILTVPGEGVWEINTNTGDITFTPEFNFNGTLTHVVYTVADTAGLASQPAIISGTVSAVNDAPVAADKSESGLEDQPVTVNVLENDTDDGVINPTTVAFVNRPEGSALSSDGRSLTVPNQGIWTIDDTTGQITFTPETDYSGTATPINYTVKDNEGLVSNPAKVTVIIAEVNDAPKVTGDVFNTTEDTPITKNVLANDNDPGGLIDKKSVTFVNPPAGTTLSSDKKTLTVANEGVWTIDATTGDVTFSPVANFNGTLTNVFYTVADTAGLASQPAIISGTVSAVNDAPVASDKSESGLEDQPVTVNVLENDTDDGIIDPTTVVFVNQAANAILSSDGKTLTVAGEGVWTINGTTGQVTFTPELDYSGTATPVNYTVKDNEGLVSNPAKVTVTLAEVNDAPKVTGDVFNTIEDTRITKNVLTNDNDPGGLIDKTSVLFVNPPAGTTLSEDGKSLTVPEEGVWTIDPETGEVTFTPEANFNGMLTHVEYTVADTAGLVSQPAIISGIVTSVNDAPIASDKSESGLEDNPVTVNVLENDTDDGTIDPTTVVFVNQAANAVLSSDGKTLTVAGEGVWTINATTGQVTFTPEEDYSGTTTPVNYTVKDNEGLVSNSATVTVTLAEVNDAPKVTGDVFNTLEDTPISIVVLANDNDPAGLIDKTSVLFVNPPSGTTLSEDGKSLTVPEEGVWTIDTVTGEVTFTPEANFNSTLTSVVYTVADTAGLVSQPAIISGTVSG